MVAEGLDRAHERIDKEIADRNDLAVKVASLAESAKHTAESVGKLAESVNKALHSSPCQTAQDLARRINDIEDAGRQTVAVAREKGRDWRGLAFEVLKFVIIGLLCYAAGKHGIQIPTP